jgi:cytochrome c-type biogenesis protein CcmE
MVEMQLPGLVLVVVFLVGCGRAREEANAYIGVAEVEARGSRLEGRTIKVRGYVVIGSIRDGSFELEDKGARILVHMTGPRPEQLRDRAEVVAAGTLRRGDSGWELTADEVFAKCPERYGAGEGSF